MSFHVGQKVVCIENGPDLDGDRRLDQGSYWCPFGPDVGGIYTVRTVEVIDDTQYLRLFEVVNPIRPYCEGPSEIQFGARRFRPLIDSRTETGVAILRKVADDAAKRRNLIALD